MGLRKKDEKGGIETTPRRDCVDNGIPSYLAAKLPVHSAFAIIIS